MCHHLLAPVGNSLALSFVVGSWQMPAPLATQSVLYGASLALWPVMWIVFGGLESRSRYCGVADYEGAGV
jgi:L-lactate permease